MTTLSLPPGGLLVGVVSMRGKGHWLELGGVLEYMGHPNSPPFWIDNPIFFFFFPKLILKILLKTFYFSFFLLFFTFCLFSFPPPIFFFFSLFLLLPLFGLLPIKAALSSFITLH